MHIFGSERGPWPARRGAGPIRSPPPSRPGTRASPAQTSTQYFTIESGPEGQPCPGPTRPFSPSFEAASASRTAGAHAALLARSHALRRRPEPRRAHGDHAAGASPRPSGAFPTAPSRRSTGSPTRSTPASPSWPPRLPARQPDRHRDRWSRGRRPPGLRVGQGLSRRPIQGRAAQPACRHTRRSPGPMTSATSPSAPRIHVDPVTAQVTTVSDPLPQIFEGIPLRTRSIRVNLDRPDFTLNPTNCDAFAVERRLRQRRGDRDPRLAFPAGQLRRRCHSSRSWG